MVIAQLNHHIPQTADSSRQTTPDSYTITVEAVAGHKKISHRLHFASLIWAEKCVWKCFSAVGDVFGSMPRDKNAS